MHIVETSSIWILFTQLVLIADALPDLVDHDPNEGEEDKCEQQDESVMHLSPIDEKVVDGDADLGHTNNSKHFVL